MNRLLSTILLFSVLWAMMRKVHAQIPIFPSASSFSHLWESSEAVSNLKPSVAVQAFVGEGLGVKGSSALSAIHVIVTVSGTDPETQVPIPYASQSLQLALRSKGNIKGVIEQGNGGFEQFQLSKTPIGFKTNNMGRVSFSIPLDSVDDKWIAFPTLYVRADFMPRNVWVAAHLSLELEHKLTKITALDLQRLNPSLGNASAASAAFAVHKLAGLMQGSIPSYSLQSGQKQRRSFSSTSSYSQKPLVNGRLHFDSSRDYLSTYTVTDPFIDSIDVERRSFHPNRIATIMDHVQPHESAQQFANGTRPWYHTGLSKRELATFKPIAVDHENGWSLAKRDSSNSIFASITRGAKNVAHYLVENVASAWKAITSILMQVGISIKSVFESFQRMFGWQDIANTKKFLRLYYQLLSPLGPKGLQILRTKYRSGVYNMSLATHGMFEKVIEGLGGHDMTLKDIKARADAIKKKTLEQHPAIHGSLPFMETSKSKADKMGNLSSTEAHSVLFASGTTNLFNDRYINNMAAMTVKNSSWPLIRSLVSLSKEAARALDRAIGRELYDQIKPHLLVFDEDTAFLKKGLGHVLNLIRSVAILGEQLSANIMDALLTVVPMYWDLALKVMNLELDIPFFNTWWGQHISRDKEAKLSVMDFLCLAGSLYATPQYKIYNGGRAPFTDTDIQVLKTSKSPELLLYTWNHDPQTYAMDNAKLRDHRLGVYDWIPRCMMTVVWLIIRVPFNAIMLADPTATVAAPPPSTHAIQVIGGIIELLGPINSYPFTQLDKNDAASIVESSSNPDPRFLQYWATWVFECFVRTIRPYMGKRMNEFPSTAIVNSVIMGVPVTVYGVKIAIDTGKDVAVTDGPRMAVMFTYWFEVVLWYVDLIWQFVSEIKANVLGRYEAILFSAAREMVSIGNGALRANLMMGFNITGMLSSSYQGGKETTATTAHG